jgi:hypothetical protein
MQGVVAGLNEVKKFLRASPAGRLLRWMLLSDTFASLAVLGSTLDVCDLVYPIFKQPIVLVQTDAVP